MADKKISQLTNLTGANLADNDEFVLVDTSADETKAITWSELKEGLDTGTGFVRITGDTMTGDLSFGDNDKAIFGAGSDLQIYHDGVTSVIQETGSGDLRLKGTNIDFKSATNETYAYFQADGPSILYHNSSDKLTTTSTGIDVTGTVTADGLTVDGVNDIIFSSGGNNVRSDGTLQIQADADGSGAGVLRLRTQSKTRQQIDNNGDISFYEDTGTTPKFFWDASAESLGIGTSSPSATLDVVSSGTGAETIAEFGNNNISDGLSIETNGNLEWGFNAKNSRSLTFSTNQTERLRIDASGNVGIGTSSPSPVGSRATVNVSSSAGAAIRLSDDTANMFIDYTDTSGCRISVNAAEPMTFSTNSVERMRIDSSGNVGIGTSSPAGMLQISATFPTLILDETNTDAAYQQTQFGLDDGSFRIQTRTSTNTFVSNDYLIDKDSSGATDHIWRIANSERMRIDSSGRVGIGTSSPSYGLDVQQSSFSTARIKRVGAGSSAVLTLEDGDGVQHNLQADAGIDGLIYRQGSTERLRIDSSGNLLVGKTSSTFNNTAGIGQFPSGRIYVTRDGGNCLYLNRVSTDGDIAAFYKDGSNVGNISVSGSSTAYNTSSDYRLKTDAQPMTGASARVQALNPVNFEWIADGTRVDGFLAHEAQAVVPEAVTGEKDGEEMQAIDQSKLVPLLTAALQEALTKIDALETRITALEG